jgi:hypothetical protein
VLPYIDNALFSFGQMRSLAQVEEMVKKNGAKVFNDLEGIAEFLNSKA